MCQFYLHPHCANSEKLIPTLKHNCHEQHNLYYFMSDNDGLFRCHVCDNSCVGSFYRCVECDENYHFECIPLPDSILKCKFHKHKPLVFKDVYAEEEYSEDHFCDACEDLRNPIYSLYFCDECLFAVDIAYCNFHMHESCLQLAFEIRHPYHKKHPLFLRILNGQFNCSKCHKKCIGFTYHCEMCSFTLDYECIQSTKQEEEEEEETEAQGSDTGHEEIDAKERTIAQLTETILGLRIEVETLREKVYLLTTERDAIKETLPNTSTRSLSLRE
ncbi:hypothetical protein SLEP1_g45000 [Rubroshorea leprosula]|uniref:Phorbol-ester/DAG-type domain-containing protein n=1 Tax=Rubroshorea leprosula TaxID=152421 RepID=A0AAV5LHY0_9ROSI|nr:hypothetical protein SLEP1_g45000 [Rubroshorea leprosula]